MDEKKFSFENLEVYKTARVLVRDVYRLQHKFPKYETYSLGDQVRRSASSVTSNQKVVEEILSKKNRILLK